MVEIIGACDAYDAPISPRRYRPVSYGNRTALEEITKMAERGKTGWGVVKALVAHNQKEKSEFIETKVSKFPRVVDENDVMPDIKIPSDSDD